MALSFSAFLHILLGQTRSPETAERTASVTAAYSASTAQETGSATPKALKAAT